LLLLERIGLLTTEKGHEVASFPFLTGSGVIAWRVVTLDLRVPYVFISYAFKEDRRWLSQSSIFWRHEDVLNFCKDIKGDKSRKILDISLLLPGAHDSGASWSLTPVEEIFAGQYKDSGLDFPLYVTVNGDKFGGLGNPGSNGTHGALEKVFPTTKRRSKPKQGS
jgi:hypothetical protein